MEMEDCRARALRTHLSQNKIFQTLRAIKYPPKGLDSRLYNFAHGGKKL